MYKTTSTLEKLITFTQNLKKELDQSQKQLGAMVNKVKQLEEDRQQFRDIHNMIEEVLDRVSRLENLDARIQYLEADRHQLQDLQQTLRKFSRSIETSRQEWSLQEHDEGVMNE